MRRRTFFAGVTALGLIACNAILGIDGDTQIVGANAVDASSTDSTTNQTDGTVPLGDGTSPPPSLDAGSDAPIGPTTFQLALFAGALGGVGDGDGAGSPSTARFNRIIGTAPDTNGNIYVIEANGTVLTRATTIRKVDATGTVTTLAGNRNEIGFADGRLATARFTNLKSIVYDPLSNRLWVLDGCRLRRIDLTGGTVTTIVGGNGTGELCESSPDEVPTLLSGSATALAIRNNGNVYIADFPYIRLYDDTSDPPLRSFCGHGSGAAASPTPGLCGGVQIKTNELVFSARDSALFYRADLGEGVAAPLRTIAPPLLPTVAAVSGDGGISTAMYAPGPGIAPGNSDGTLFLAEGRQLRYIDRGLGTQNIAAGSNSDAPMHVDGTGLGVRFEAIGSFVQRSPQDYVIGDLSSVRISKENALSTLAGLAGANGFVEGVLEDARFGNAASIAIGPKSIYFYDSIFATVNTVDLQSGIVKVLAGTPTKDDNVSAISHTANGIVFNGKTLYISDASGLPKLPVVQSIDLGTGGLSNVKQKFSLGNAFTADPATGLIYFANEKAGQIMQWTGDDSEATPFVDMDASLGGAVGIISGMCWEESIGGLVIADSQTNVISTVVSDSNGVTITPVAGTAMEASHRDSTDDGSTAAFIHPRNIACSGSGIVMVNELTTGTIRAVELKKSGRVTTLAGSLDGQQGIILGAPNRLNATSALAFLPGGGLLIGGRNEGAILGLVGR